jgi:hypothetical protein
MKRKFRPQAIIDEIIISDEAGHVEKTIRGHSLCKGMLFHLYMNSFGSGGITGQVYDMISNALETMASSFNFINLTDASPPRTNIVVGTGNSTPESVDNQDMDAMIAHGSGSGQLIYAAPVTTLPIKVGSDWQIDWTRMITNNSGADITVNEIGITCANSNLGTIQYLLSRVLSTFVIANTASKVITYRIKVLG